MLAISSHLSKNVQDAEDEDADPTAGMYASTTAACTGRAPS